MQTVADELDISVQTVRRLIAIGELQAVRFGAALRVPRAVLEAYLEENRVMGRAEKRGSSADDN
jgi:excisionase family DNA binding protein